METDKKVGIPLELNRASIGDSEYPFAILQAEDGVVSVIAYVPKEKITLDEQPVGKTITGKLDVHVIQEEGELFLVETDSDNGPIRFWINSKSGKITKKVDMSVYPQK